MSEIFVISDTHFGHENIIKYCDRPFNGAFEMDEVMIEKWNSVVKPQDKVYHLGDVYMGLSTHASSTLSRLNGKKRLILGNHDNGKDQVLLKYFQKIDVWRMFSEFGLLLTHVPVHPRTLGEGRFKGEGMVNIHGHIHTDRVLRHIEPDERYRCVCVEQIDYTPVNIEELRVK